MSMDTCKSCGNFVDTDADTDCYDNPVEQCQCVNCRENCAAISGWLPIEIAPQDRDIDLAGYIIPSAEAYRNGSRSHWTFGTGRHFGAWWTGILGGKPSHWKEQQAKG